MTQSFIDLATLGVQKLKPYQPGKPVEELERELGIQGSIKLASNENPLGPSAMALEAIKEHMNGINYYPDGSGYKLSRRIAEMHQLETEQVTLGNGSNDILELVTRAYLTPDRSAVYSEYSFAVYPIVVQAVGAKARVAAANPIDHEQPLGHDLDAFLSNIEDDTRMIFVANPNNPTGTWIEPEVIEDFLDHVPGNIIVVLDLAYIEYMDDMLKPNIKNLLDRFPNLVITCTFSKVYALAGLRIGYSLTNPEIADVLNRVRQPFNTNLLAQQAAMASLDDGDHVQKSVQLNTIGKVYLQEQLDRMGLSYLPTMGNFISIRFKQDAQAIYNELLKKGVIVRPVANYSMPEYLRVTIGTQDQNQRFVTAISDLLE